MIFQLCKDTLLILKSDERVQNRVKK